MNNEIQLISPFPTRDLPWLWLMLLEFPLSNLDNSGPTDLPSLARQIRRRYREGETIWKVVQAGQPIGVIGYAPISSFCAGLHGICFISRVHRTGIPFAAMAMALDRIFATGVDRIVAGHFIDNAAVTKFLAKFGFVEHRCDRHYVSRCGASVEVRIVELTKDKYNKVIAMQKVGMGVEVIV